MVEKQVMSCPECRDLMYQGRAFRSGTFSKVFAFVVFWAASGMMLASPALPLLSIPGVLLFAAAWWIGFRRVNIWLCASCAHSVYRHEILDT